MYYLVVHIFIKYHAVFEKTFWEEILGQYKKMPVYTLTVGWDFLEWCGLNMWPMMFIYITVQVSGTFYFSFSW